MSKDLRKGWTTSVAIHVVLLVILMMIEVPTLARKAEFVEVVWGSSGNTGIAREVREPEQKQASEPKPLKAPKTTVATKQSSQPVVLPERKLASLSEESLPVSRSKKIESYERAPTMEKPEAGIRDNREQRAGTRGDAEKELPGGGVGSGVGGVRGDGSEVEGSDIDRNIGFSIQWSAGGTRKKLSGSLPRYPEGVNLEAQIKILTVVAPDGIVKNVQPAQKADTRLENAAMKEMRFWKFESLKPNQPQVDQTCVVTFLFRLK